jgi:predicted  nucleic acid-binding Zn-ribbon protein
LTYEKYDLLQKIMETEKNLKNINEKIVYSSNKAASLEQDLKKIKLNRPGLDLEKVEKIEKSEKTENGKLMERQSKARIATVLNSMSSSKILSSKLKYLESELVSLNKTQEKIQENLQEKDKTLNRFKSQLKVLPEFDLFRSASVQPGRLKINPLKRYHK